MHAVLFELARLDGSECAQPHMQGHRADLNSPAAQAFEDLAGEVESGSWRCHGSGIDGVDRLVTLNVNRARHSSRAADIGWQRHFTDLSQILRDVERSGETQPPMAFLVDFHDFSLRSR